MHTEFRNSFHRVVASGFHTTEKAKCLNLPHVVESLFMKKTIANIMIIAVTPTDGVLQCAVQSVIRSYVLHSHTSSMSKRRRREC